MWSTPRTPGRPIARSPHLWIPRVNTKHQFEHQGALAPCDWIQTMRECERHHVARRGSDMPERTPLDATAEWVELSVTQADWDAAEPHLLTSMLSQLVFIRTFEEFVL